MAKKLSTQEILAKARAAASEGQPPENSPAESASAESAPATPAAESPAAAAGETTAAETPPAAPAATPKSTKDILAAARAQSKGGAAAAKPASAAGNGDKPKSTKDILAAARAQKSGGGAAPAAKPAAAATATKAAPAVKPGGKAPSVQEMVKAIAEGKKDAPAVAPKAAAPKLPKKPVPAASGPAKKASRRAVLSWFAVAWISLTAASIAALLGMARFMFPNVLVEPPSRFKIGPPSDYPFGTVSTKWTQQFAVWIVHTNWKGKNLVYALSTVCTHLGCTPNWLDGEQKFKCPCHGSGFYITGVNFEGPAPRPLERHGIRVAPDGMLEVDKSIKFQEELGQWESPESFVEIV